MLAIFSLFGLLGCHSQVEGRSLNVLVMIMDGVRSEDFSLTTPSDVMGQSGEAAAHNTWQQLGGAGTAVRRILNPGITLTASSHAALLTGRIHAYGNLAEPLNGPSLYRPEYPTLFQALKDQLGVPQSKVRFIGNTELLDDVSGTLYPGLAESDTSYEALLDERGAPDGDDQHVFDRMKEIISEDHPCLLVANIHNVDRMGHFNPDQYGPGVTLIDEAMGDFWSYLEDKEPEYLANTLVILTTDHGRHSIDQGQDPYWREHGDSCTGCRELPLFLIGPGISAGKVVEPDESAWTQEDLTVLIAGWLGIEMPFAEGLAMSDLVDGIALPNRSGEVSVSQSGNSVARRVWLSDLNHRSEIQVNSTVVSNPMAFDTAAPTVLEVGNERFVCWREILSDPVEDLLPWVPRCLHQVGDEDWVDIGFVEDNVGIAFEPVLAMHAGSLYVGYVNNPNTVASEGNPDNMLGVGLSRYFEGAWSPPQYTSGTFSTELTMSIGEDGTVGLAAALTGETSRARYSRQIGVLGEAGWTRFDLAELMPEAPHRVGRPAIRVSNQRYQIAALGWDTSQSILAFWESTDAGAHWESPHILPTMGLPFAHLSPQWDGEFLVWASLNDSGNAQLCRMIPLVDQTPSCVSLASDRLDSFSVENGQAAVSVDMGSGNWQIQEVVF